MLMAQFLPDMYTCRGYGKVSEHELMADYKQQTGQKRCEGFSGDSCGVAKLHLFRRSVQFASSVSYEVNTVSFIMFYHATT